MSASRLRQLLQKIQEKLQKLGATNKTKWGMFSTDTEMTLEQFTNRLEIFGISISIQDAATLWRATGINSEVMQYGDFIRFLQAENVNLMSPSKVSTKTLEDSLKSNKRALVMKCLDADPTTSGFISYRAFSDICSWFDPEENGSSMLQLVQRYDPTDSGTFNYFSLISDLCSNTIPEPSPRAISPVITPPHIDVSFSHSSERSLKSPTYSPRFSPDYGTPPRSSPCSRLCDSPPTSGRRGRLDPAIFGTSAPSSPGSSGGRGRLDPAIFGQQPIADPVPRQNIQTADDIAGAEHLVGLTSDQIITLLSRQVSKIGSSNKAIFTRWRGSHDYLDANDIRNNLARETNIVIPLRDLQIVVDQYGGALSLSGFVRMLGDGARMVDESRTISGVRQQTEDEAALIAIADQLYGIEWCDALARAQTVDDSVRILARFGCRADPAAIRTLQAKLGKVGLVKALQARVQ